jgi:AcrR family transcriptional regulator|tara:strand:- start:349 stop:969 length:621 start_codon:yes stop_codon:yes gene_type:complete
MGRKAINKERKPLNTKQQKWLGEVMPYFYKNGVRKPTMDDIAEHLHLSKATIYNYYSSKEDLIHDAMWLKLVELQKFRDLLFDDSVEFKERYYKGAQFFTKSLKGMSALYLEDLKNYFPKTWADIDLFREKSVENIKTYYQAGINKEIFRNFNVHMMAEADLFFFDMMIDAKFLRKNNITVEVAFDQYFKMKFDGVLAVEKLTFSN